MKPSQKTALQTTLLGKQVTLLKPRHEKDTPAAGVYHLKRYGGQRATICTIYQKDGVVCYDLLLADGTIWTDAPHCFFRVGEIDLWQGPTEYRCPVCDEPITDGQQMTGTKVLRHISCT